MSRANIRFVLDLCFINTGAQRHNLLSFFSTSLQFLSIVIHLPSVSALLESVLKRQQVLAVYSRAIIDRLFTSGAICQWYVYLPHA